MANEEKKYLGQAGTEALVQKIGDALSTKITTPADASIGQTIIVKTIDENGNVSEWGYSNVSANNIYIHEDEPADAPDGSLWVDLDEKGNGATQDSSTVFSGAVASFYGDSLTEVNYHYTKGYHKWVQELLGLSVYNNYGKSGYKVSDVYNKVNSTIDTANLVFVMCGVNDQNFSVPLGQFGDSTIDTIYGSLNLLCGALKQKYPNSTVVFITPHYQTKYPHSEGITSYEVAKAIREVCGKYAIPVFDNFILSGIYSTNMSTFTTDNCHWNDTAHEMVGRNLANFMKNTFGYIYGSKKVDTDGSDDETGVAHQVEITGTKTAGQFHLSMYVTQDELPQVTEGIITYGFDIEPLTQFNVAANQTGGVYLVDEVNNLLAGYTMVGQSGMPANIVDNGNGTYSISGRQPVHSAMSSITQIATKPYWCFPINTQFPVGAKFNIINPWVKVDDTEYEIHAIGGAFAEETLVYNHILAPTIINDSVESVTYSDGTLTFSNLNQTFAGVIFDDVNKMTLDIDSNQENFFSTYAPPHGWFVVRNDDIYHGIGAYEDKIETWDFNDTLTKASNQLRTDIEYPGTGKIVLKIESGYVNMYFNDSDEPVYSTTGDAIGYMTSKIDSKTKVVYGLTLEIDA